ncbi:MAG: alpha/beta fold hydrolase [Cyanobacteria bacterium P01_F01_bin.143]
MKKKFTLLKKNQQMIFKLIISIFIIYCGLIVTLFFTQRKLLYFPSNNLPTEEFLQAEGLQYWDERENNYSGLISTEPQNNAQGTMIVFHGNGSAAHHLDEYSRALTARGYRVLLAEYPGYAIRPGKPSESVFIADARRIVNLIHQEYGEPIYLWGESLGCGVVAATVADPNLPVAGIVLINPWDSLVNLAQSIYWFVPVRVILLDKFDSINNLKLFKGKVAILISEEDKVIPPRFGLNLYNSVRSDKQLWKFANAGHNSWPDGSQESWWQEVIDFISK